MRWWNGHRPWTAWRKSGSGKDGQSKENLSPCSVLGSHGFVVLVFVLVGVVLVTQCALMVVGGTGEFVSLVILSA